MAYPFPIPENERERLSALKSLDIVDSERSLDFDAVLSLALKITGCPVGYIGLMESDRYWLKAEHGTGQSEVPRAVSLCNYTILQSEPLLIENLSLDERFSENPFVTNEGARFYAGVALQTAAGYRIGTLCVVDLEPRTARRDLIETMRDLARVIESLIEAYAQTARAEIYRRAAEDHARDIWQKTRLIAQTERLAKVGAWEHDLATGLLEMSDECYRIHGFEPGDHVDLATIRLLRTPSFRARSLALFEIGANYDMIGEIVTTHGERRWIHIISETEKRDGKVVRFFGTVRNVTVEHEAEQVLWRAAHYDALTGSPNRYHWTLKLERAFEEASPHRFPLSILIFDLDGFKEINDTKGHPTGDLVLREIAARMAATLPPDTFHARLGGDEFAILLFGPVATANLEMTARAVLGTMRKPIMIAGNAMRVSGTFGGATYPKDGETADDLMKKADIALYQAKRSQRSSFLSFRPEIGAIFDNKRGAIETVAVALDAGRLVPFYQPKVDIRTGQCVGFEALCRIEAADGTIIGPSQFHPAFEDATIVARIGVAMLHRVTTDIAGWRRDGLVPGRVALNVATSDFIDGQLANRILDRLRTTGLPSSALEIEVVENTLIGAASGAVLDALRALTRDGIVVSLDDFGTGYASLTHLRDTPIQCIKIDRSFIAGLGATSDSGIIVRSLVKLGHDLKLTIVAEGVETEMQVEFLRKIGCDVAQGFLFGRPASHAATTTMLKRPDKGMPPAEALAG